MDQLINLNTTYWARIKAPNGYPTYLALWVDRVSRSMADRYPILHTTTTNGRSESFYYKGYVPPQDMPRDLQLVGCIVLDLEPLDIHRGIAAGAEMPSPAACCPAIDPAALYDFLS